MSPSRCKPGQCGADLGGRLSALHGAGRDNDLPQGIAPPQYLDDVMQHGARQRRDHADTPWQRRQRAFMIACKQPFGIQPRLELLELRRQQPDTFSLQLVDVQLIDASSLIDGDIAARQHPHAVLDRLRQALGLVTPHDATDLAARILEREVDMT